MTPHYDQDGITIYHGDCREVLPGLPDGSVQCVVTSPPYWGLRSYLDDEHSQKEQEIGLESTPEAYVETMVGVFREVRRVLRDDGTCWINLGDSYARQGGDGPGGGNRELLHMEGTQARCCVPPAGLKPKDLVGIPWRLAFALQADGWWLRQDIIEEVELYCPCGCGYVLEERIWRHSPDRDIIWSKPNAMPESVTDRCTKAHEYLFLLSKKARYHYDADAIAEPSITGDTRKPYGSDGAWYMDGRNKWDEGKGEQRQNADPSTRNRRSVWTIPTYPCPDAHFATFPPKLIEPCIKAGCPAGGVVLDPFAGSGVTAMVAKNLGCKCISIELNEEYLKMQTNRLAQGVLF